MSGSTAKITLDGVEYTVPAFNIDQLMRVTDLMQPDASGNQPRPDKVAFNVLLIGLERADPPVDKPRDVRATTGEVMAAVPILMKLAGLQQSDENPPEAAAKKDAA